MRTLRLALSATVLAAALLLPTNAARAGACAATDGAMEYVTPRTFYVQVGKLSKTYNRGDVVKVKVTVSRPSDEDPTGLGVPVERPTSAPAQGVNVGVGISIGRVFLPGYARTDANGVATAKIKLEKYVPSAAAHVRAFAYKETLQTPCLTIEEQGYRAVDKAFRVR